MTQLVDDRVLAALLRGGDSPRPTEPVYTTGCWYARLCQAALSATERTGALSALFADQSPELRSRALTRLLELPEDIGLESLRTLAPLIGRLRRRHQLNLLGIEALAAAVHLEASVYLSVASPRLEEALRREGLSVEVVPESTRRLGNAALLSSLPDLDAPGSEVLTALDEARSER